jgi:hypothetical protein
MATIEYDTPQYYGTAKGGNVKADQRDDEQALVVHDESI